MSERNGDRRDGGMKVREMTRGKRWEIQLEKTHRFMPPTPFLSFPYSSLLVSNLS